MSQSTVIRILIVDDRAIVQQGIAAILDEETDMTAIGRAKDGIEAIELFRREQPDVTLMDLRMPRMGGVEAIAAICAEAKGISNLEISIALNISESTVKSNINRILSKLGAKDCTQATIIALKRGIASL